MTGERPLFFALHGSQDYARRVAQRLGCELSEHEERPFEDGAGRKCNWENKRSADK